MTDILARSANFVAMQQSPETRRAYSRDLRVLADFLSEREITTITNADAIEFRDYLVDEYTPNGAARVWNTVRTFYRGELRGDSPFEWVKAPKRTANTTPKVPSDEDVAALIGAAWDNPQRSLIIALLLNGLRASEVGGLVKGNVEQHEGATILRIIGKGQKERMVPATIEVERAMTRYDWACNDRQGHSHFVVSDWQGDPLRYRQVEHAVYKSAEYAGVEGMHPHALRHHYATRLIRSGVSVLHVQKLLGHAKVSTTEAYVGLDLADLIRASRLDPRNQPSQPAVRVVA